MIRLTLPLLFVFASCLPAQGPETEIEASVSLPFAEIGRGRQALVDTVHRAILHKEEWAVMEDSLRPLRPFTLVDFSLEMVLVAALPVPNAAFDLRFEEIEERADSLVARYRLYVPGFDCRPTVGNGNAFQVVRVGARDKPVRFERLEEAVDCTEP